MNQLLEVLITDGEKRLQGEVHEDICSFTYRHGFCFRNQGHN